MGIIQVVPTTSPQDVATSNLIQHLRSSVIPAAEQGTSLQVYVGGMTAIFDDFADVLTSKLPIFLGVIVLLGLLLLMLAFRSLLVPATAAVMNLLAAGASFGVVTAVFQWGWGTDLLHLGKAGPVEAFLPVIMLSILFGLSMDYQVFVVSRIKEARDAGMPAREAVTAGIAASAKVVTSAAVVMVTVFAGFVALHLTEMKQMGFCLALAVLLDAVVIRLMVLPAALLLLGERAWWRAPRGSAAAEPVARAFENVR